MSKQTTTAAALRQLVYDIKALANASSVHSIATPIITNTCDHLSAIARIHELNEVNEWRRKTSNATTAASS